MSYSAQERRSGVQLVSALLLMLSLSGKKQNTRTDALIHRYTIKGAMTLYFLITRICACGLYGNRGGRWEGWREAFL